jgi:LacI family transcriptional regulator
VTDVKGGGADPGRPASPRVTIADVAAHAGVSATTVSHVLSGKRQVGATSHERVLAAVRELGYRPNHVARNLRTRRSQAIAVIVPDITNPFYGVLTRGLADAVDRAGYGTYVCNTDALLEREQKFVEDALDRGVDGIVLAPVHFTDDDITELSRFGIPIVCLSDRTASVEVDRVLVDDEEGAWAATRHLLGRNPRHLAMITGPPGAGLARLQGYRRALQEAGRTFDPDLTRDGRWSRAGGDEAMRSLMARPARPDAVFCANDLMALGAMDAARQLGLAIPADVAVAGFDDVEVAELVTPTLTTVVNPSYETGFSAGELLLGRMRGDAGEERRTVVMPCRLVARESA